jgi:hypothetical protein
LLSRNVDWDSRFWNGLEEFVYFSLFLTLLFYATARTSRDFTTTSKMLQVTLTAVGAGIALGRLAKPPLPARPMVCESGMQTAFPFNS